MLPLFPLRAPVFAAGVPIFSAFGRNLVGKSNLSLMWTPCPEVLSIGGILREMRSRRRRSSHNRTEAALDCISCRVGTRKTRTRNPASIVGRFRTWFVGRPGNNDVNIFYSSSRRPTTDLRPGHHEPVV